MKAAVIQENHTVAVQDVPKPRLTGSNDVLIRATAWGLNPTDWSICGVSMFEMFSFLLKTLPLSGSTPLGSVHQAAEQGVMLSESWRKWARTCPKTLLASAERCS